MVFQNVSCKLGNAKCSAQEFPYGAAASEMLVCATCKSYARKRQLSGVLDFFGFVGVTQRPCYLAYVQM
jgi:hypothetical protein